MDCLLCSNMKTALYWKQTDSFNAKDYYKDSLESIDFYQCPECELIFKDPKNFINSENEKNRYNSHENRVGDTQYEKFLKQLVTPLLPYLKIGDVGLDYGCGPGPALQKILIDLGFHCEVYDPFFYPETKILDKKYEFIVSTEVVEHFYLPQIEFEKIFSMLKHEGVLGLMTGIYPTSLEDFKKWWYHRDPTHVVFYNENTMKFLAKKYNKTVSFPQKNIIIFSK
jgi:hypothetical protein